MMGELMPPASTPGGEDVDMRSDEVESWGEGGQRNSEPVADEQQMQKLHALIGTLKVRVFRCLVLERAPVFAVWRLGT